MPLTGQGTGFAGLVAPGGCIPALSALSRDAALLGLAHAAAAMTGLPVLGIRDRLLAREAAGSTACGSGAAIPHARVPGIATCMALVARLPSPIEWHAVDGLPVDLLVLLLSPPDNDSDHLKALARISRSLRDADTLAALRAAGTADAMLAAIAPLPALVA